jgi:membrane protein
VKLSDLGLGQLRNRSPGAGGSVEREALDQPGERGGLVVLARRTLKDVAESDVPGLAAEMAYHSLFALFAFLLFMAGLTAVADDLFGIDDMRDRLVESGQDILPENASSVFQSFLDDVVDSRGQGAVIFGLGGLIWSGSALVGSAMKALNRISKLEEKRGMIKRRLLAMALALGLGALLISATLLIIFRGAFADALQEATGSRAAAEFTAAVLSWPLALMIFALAAAVLYWLGPDRDQPFRWVTPGAVLFAIGWALASIIISVYLTNAGSFNRTYGLIVAVLAAIVWLYWSNLLFLAGAVLNARVEDVKEEGSPSFGRAEQDRPAQP